MKKVLRGVFMSTLCAAVAAETVFFSSATAFAADGSNEIAIEESAAEEALEETPDEVKEISEEELVEEAAELVSEVVEAENPEEAEEAATETSAEETEDILKESKVSEEQTVKAELTSENEEAVTWNFDASTGTLTISGKGPMQDLANKKDAPWYSVRSKIRKIVVEEGVTRIGSRSFGDINSGTTRVSDYAKVVLPSTLESIGGYAFDYAFINGDLVIPESVTSMDPFALTSVRIPAGFLFINAKITKLEANACKGIMVSRVYLPDTLEEIGDNAFQNALSLKSIEFPKNLKKIGSKAFSYKMLATVKFTGDLPEVAEDGFKGAADNIVVIYDAGNRTWKDVTADKLGMGSLNPQFQPEGEPWVEPEEPEDPEPEEPSPDTPVNPENPSDEPEIKTGLVTRWGATYYFDENGTKLTGFQTIDEKLYYFNDKGVMQKQVWIVEEGVTYYVKSDGTIAENQMLEIRGKSYVFGDKGVLQTGFISFDGKDYYAGADGELVKSDWIVDGDHTYYAKADLTLAKNETIKKWGKKYSFDENGFLIK